MVICGNGASDRSQMRANLYRRKILTRCSSFALTALALAVPSLASAQEATSQPASQPATPAPSGGEIVVTAQRRSQRITDVPYNISAVTSSQLTASGTSNGSDLGNVVVGLNTVNEGPVSQTGDNDFTLRGLRSDAAGPTPIPTQSVPTVSTYFGDSPLPFALLMKDLQRVEILRGPQGTLYGSGAEGGTIRFIPNRPSFDKVSGEINATGSKTQHSEDGNGSVDGVINIPITDRFAIRLVAAYTRQAGFIDKVDLFEKGADGVPLRSVPSDITSGPVIAPVKRGANSSYQYMARAEVRYKPTDWLDMEVDYTHQKSHADDQQYTNPYYPAGVEDFSSGIYPNAAFDTRAGGKLLNTIQQLEPTTGILDLVSGTIAADLDFATLTSVSSYSRSKTTSVTDSTGNYILPDFSYLPLYNNYPDFSAPGYLDNLNKGFSEEVRLVSQPNKPITYVIGAYYENRHTSYAAGNTIPGIYAFSDFIGAPGANPQELDLAYTTNNTTRARDLAGFGEITYHPTRKWQITGGFRVFHDSVKASVYNTAPFFGALFGDGVTPGQSLGAVGANTSQSISSHIFKANTSYDVARDAKIYATYSRGFRRGGANALPIAGGFASLPVYETFAPDFADNYEVGFKGLALDRRFSYSISAYLINLKNFQVDGFSPALLPAVFNGKLARSKGIESEFTYQATRQLSLSAGYTFTDSKVVKGSTLDDYAPATLVSGGTPQIVVGTSIPAGALLPGVSRNNLIASADYRFPLGDSRAITLHGNMNYRSSQHSTIDTTSAVFTIIPSNVTADARITYDTGKRWTASLYVTNLNNSIGYSGASGIQSSNYLYQKWLVAVPRTVGIDLHHDF